MRTEIVFLLACFGLISAAPSKNVKSTDQNAWKQLTGIESIGEHNGKEFFVVLKTSTQDQAAIACEGVGLELGIIEDQSELDFVGEWQAAQTNDVGFLWTAGRMTQVLTNPDGSPLNPELPISYLSAAPPPPAQGLHMKFWASGPELTIYLSNAGRNFLCTRFI